MSDWEKVRDEAAVKFSDENYGEDHLGGIHAFQAGYNYAIENDPRVKIAIDILKENDRSCDFDLIQKTVDGVFLQGTKHNENCRRCRLIKALEGGEK